MLRFVIVICLITIAQLAFAQETSSSRIRPEIQKIADAMVKDGRVRGEYIGATAMRPAQWDRFIQLDSIATIAELETLVENAHPIVQCYAFQSLAKRSPTLSFPILLNHLHDTTHIYYQYGCVTNGAFAADYFISVSHADAGQQKTIDSILLYDKTIKLKNRTSLLRDGKFTEQQYKRIREIALTEKDEAAMLALFRYKKEENNRLIKRGLKRKSTQYQALYGVREKPDAAFYPVLIKVFNKRSHDKRYDYSITRMLYQALAKYPPNSTTIKIFENALQDSGANYPDDKAALLLIAITKYPNPNFEYLKQRITIPQDLKQYFDADVQSEY